ncbi:hypothetical protein J6590_050299 [Homalodisca vitripennis]|nr:hypothetical protein J6590_050299 [Homalodisca vitripennis]
MYKTHFLFNNQNYIYSLSGDGGDHDVVVHGDVVPHNGVHSVDDGLGEEEVDSDVPRGEEEGCGDVPRGEEEGCGDAPRGDLRGFVDTWLVSHLFQRCTSL